MNMKINKDRTLHRLVRKMAKEKAIKKEKQRIAYETGMLLLLEFCLNLCL